MLEAAVKAIVYGATLLGGGAVAAYWIAVRGRSSSAVAEARLRRIGLTAWSFALVALCARAGAHTVAAFGWSDAWSADALALIALKSQWGRAWQRELVAAALAATTLLFAYGFAGWATAATTSVIAASSLALTGHAEGDGLRMALHAVHIGAASCWLGSLAALAIVRGALPGPQQDVAFRRFSPSALVCAALLAGTGVTAACLYVGAVSNLWTTEYGRILIVKLLAFCGVLGCGLANWRRVRSGHVPAGHVLATEVTFAAAVLMVTGWLTETAHP